MANYQYKILDWDMIDKYVTRFSENFIEQNIERMTFTFNHLSNHGSWEFVESSKDRNNKPIFIFKRSAEGAYTDYEKESDDIGKELIDIELS
ncbi:MAG: hypothetical protein JXA60_06835 [Candidatus Coatesbacteria bacterium]|nr:hypothetical protein [Candidatus Coatesbacteria bacterium]